MTKLLSLLLAACGPILPAPPPPPPPTQPAGTVVDFEVHGTAPPATSANETPVPGTQLDQPPHIKLKLGHFRNSRLNIGVTIDLVSAATDNVADIDPAKLQFDGDSQVWLLEGRHGGSGRIDYVRNNDRVMLQVTSGGRYTVYVPDPETDRGSPIDVTRDGDANPL